MCLVASLSILTTCESSDAVLQGVRKVRFVKTQTHLHLLMVSNGM